MAASKSRRKKPIQEAANDLFAWLGSERCACIGIAGGRILVYMKRKRDLDYVPMTADGYQVRAIYSGRIKPAGSDPDGNG